MTREEAKRILYVYRAVNLVDASHREAFDMAISELEQEPFINKPCISVGICEHDKNIVLDKIRAEIEQIEINGHIRDVECFSAGINVALNVIDKYRAESEVEK